jgi:glycosyltransferase involved in cell wall biosynthesis
MRSEPHTMIVGLRGFPGVQGGVETHAEHLFPIIAELGFKVTVITRSSRLHEDCPEQWHGVHFVRLWAPKSKALETIVHTFIGVLYAALTRPDILHIQAVGPALWTPLARTLGLRVVVTHHGPDYDRQKWGRAAKLVLRCGEFAGMRFANRRISISECIRRLVVDKYGLESAFIPNGVQAPLMPSSAETLKTFDLSPGRYVLMVSRLVPEKRHEDLIQAFVGAGLPGWKLVLVGGADHPDTYSRKIEHLVAQTPNVVATGFLTGLALEEIYANAGLFVLPSSHEGLPIALLEAISYGLLAISTNIPANLEVGLPSEHYFSPGDVNALTERIRKFAQSPFSEEERRRNCEWVVGRYNWGDSARETVGVYRSLLGGGAATESEMDSRVV